MIRIIMLHLSIFAAYLVMRSGGNAVNATSQWWKIPLGVGLLLLGIWLSGVRFFRRQAPHRAPQLRARMMHYFAGLGVFSLLNLYFFEVPTIIGGVASKLAEVFSSEESQARASVSQATRNGGSTQGNWLWNSATIRPLPRKTDLKPGNKPEAFLQFSDTAEAADLQKKSAYVSAFALGKYDQSAWMLTGADQAQPRVFPQRIGKTYRYEIFHAADEGEQNPILALQGMISAEISPLDFLGDGITLLPKRIKGEGYRYVATSQPLKIADLGDDIQAAKASDVPSDWLALPQERQLDTRIRALCIKASPGVDTREKLLKLRDFLQNEFRYSLRIKNEQNLDPLENFLFHEKVGHCELFASAGALAARALGVPSRVAYGWTGGSYFENSNLFVFRAKEAHAWTEVLIDQVGWVILDCTPNAAISQSREASDEEDPINKDDLLATNAYDEQADLAPPFLTQALVFTACVALLCIGLLSFFQKNQCPSMEGITRKSSGRCGYLLAFYRYCERLGVRIFPADTVKKLLHRLPHRAAWLENLMKYHYRVQYGNAPRDQKYEEQLRRECDDQQR